MSVLYPVAATAEEALSKPLGRAAREREARAVVKADDAETLFFMVEEVGPAYDTREAALEANKGLIDDARSAVAPEDRYCTVREVMAPVKGKTPRVKPVKPAFKDGRRWPAPAKASSAPKTQWRLSVSYWRVGPPPASAPSALAPARKVRRDQSARDLGHDALEALTRQPLSAIAPQRPLDIGLFETRAPENPDLVLPDE